MRSTSLGAWEHLFAIVLDRSGRFAIIGGRDVSPNVWSARIGYVSYFISSLAIGKVVVQQWCFISLSYAPLVWGLGFAPRSTIVLLYLLPYYTVRDCDHDSWHIGPFSF